MALAGERKGFLHEQIMAHARGGIPVFDLRPGRAQAYARSGAATRITVFGSYRDAPAPREGASR